MRTASIWLFAALVGAGAGAPTAGAATNNIFTVAGSGTQGSAGDDGPATAAELSFPRSLAVTAEGGFLIGGDNRVRRVSPAGTITTVAGPGTRDGRRRAGHRS